MTDIPGASRSGDDADMVRFVENILTDFVEGDFVNKGG